MTISLSELAKLRLDEGILDDIDTQLAAGDKYMDLKRVEKWAEKSRKKPYFAKQKKGLVLVGDYEINDIDEEEYSGTVIKRVTGNLTITNCDLKNLNGLFAIDCEISGTLTIEDNKNLVSLEGHPFKVGSLVISGNTNLKKIESTPLVSNNLYLYKNGKKFKKEDLLKNTNVIVYKNIFCSEESDDIVISESQINEAVKAPQLMILLNAINSAKDKESKNIINNFFGHFPWDKINASDVYEYDCKDPQALPAAKQYISSKRRGFFFTLNSNGEVIAVYSRHGRFRLIDDYGNRRKIYQYSDLLNAPVYQTEREIKSANTLIIVDLNRYKDTYDIIAKRSEIKRDAVALKRGDEMDPRKKYYNPSIVRYYQSIADANRERYNKLLTQIKAERAAKTNTFTELKTKIDDLFARYTNLLEKILKDPKKYSTFDLEYLNRRFKYTNSTSKYSSIENGLIPSLEKYFKFIISSSKGSGFYGHHSDIEDKIKNLENDIREQIRRTEDYIKELENK